MHHILQYVFVGFRTFSVDEQISMVQASMFPIVVVIMSLEYDIERNKYSWFKFTDSEKDIILSHFEPYRYLEPAMHSMGHVIHQLAPDPTELSFLCGLHLIDCGSLRDLLSLWKGKVTEK